MNNSRFALMHDVLYSYYRSGVDVFFENEEAGRSGIINALNFLNTLNTENPNSMVMQTLLSRARPMKRENFQ